MNNLLLKAYVKMQVLKTSILKDESGQDLVEYALVVGIISLGATATMPTVANAIANCLLNSRLQSTPSLSPPRNVQRRRWNIPPPLFRLHDALNRMVAHPRRRYSCHRNGSTRPPRSELARISASIRRFSGFGLRPHGTDIRSEYGRVRPGPWDRRSIMGIGRLRRRRHEVNSSDRGMDRS